MPRKANKTTPKPSMLANQRTKVKATKLEAGPATVRGGQAPGAGRTAPKPAPKPRSGQGSGRGSAPGMVNANKPTMQKIQAKADALRQRTQNPTPRGQGSAVRMPNSARAGTNLPRAGAAGMRTIGDSGQVRAAQQRGKAEVAKAQARRGARAASQRMAGRLAQAQAARTLGTIGKMGGRAALFYEGIKANNTAKGTLAEAKKKYGAKATPQKQGPTQKTTQSSFNKKSFDQAFSAARSSGAKEFTWRGKRYNTKLK